MTLRTDKFKDNILVYSLLMILSISSIIQVSLAWSNGGYSSDSSNISYGTHDWIAQHALDWLPDNRKQYILDNLQFYLYGTELPDNGNAPDGIGDTSRHHIYYHSDETLQDDSAASRAKVEYEKALNYLKQSDLKNAAKCAGIMTHYIADMSAFGHVMGSETDWGKEIHHSDYENYVNTRTSNYNSEFSQFLEFDGQLDNISAYSSALNLAYDTTFDKKGSSSALWMDQNYNWNNSTFKNRAIESLNLAINYITDVLYTLSIEANTPNQVTTIPSTTDKLPSSTPQTSTPISSGALELALSLLLVVLAVVIIALAYLKGKRR